MSDWVDLEKNPYILKWIMAWNFANGNLLSPVLKDNGEIFWHWNLLWDTLEAPEQEPVVELIGNLSDWRRNLGSEFLIDGRMQKLPSVQCGTQLVYLKQDRSEVIPLIESALWSNKAGEKALFLVNYNETDMTCAVDVAGTLIKRNGEAIEFAGGEVNVPKLDAVMIKIK